MVGDVYVACALRFGEWGSEMLERWTRNNFWIRLAHFLSTWSERRLLPLNDNDNDDNDNNDNDNNDNDNNDNDNNDNDNNDNDINDNDNNDNFPCP